MNRKSNTQTSKTANRDAKTAASQKTGAAKSAGTRSGTSHRSDMTPGTSQQRRPGMNVPPREPREDEEFENRDRSDE